MSNEAGQQVESKTFVLTPENAAEFYAKKLDLAPPATEPPPEEKKEAVNAEEIKQEELELENAEKEQEKKDPPKAPQSKVAKRFSELTTRAKAAEAKAAEAEAKATAAENRAKELEAKADPAPKVEADGRPDPDTYKDAFKYAEDLAKWTTKTELAARDKITAEATAKAERDTTVKTFRERQDNFKKATADYEDVIAGATVQVSAEMEHEIITSEVGPQLLYHFAQHPEDAERLGKLTVGGMLRELGKLEARLEKVKEPVKAEVKAAAEISKAPEPITPINAGKSPAEVPINGKGEFTGTPKQWRDLRRAGKIH